MRSALKFVPAILAVAFWASNFVFSIGAITAVGPIQLSGARWLISLVLLIPLALLVERADWRVVRSEWKLHLGQSVLGYSGYTLLLYYALQSTSSFSASIIVALNPAIISLGARIFLKERLQIRSVLGIALSFLGAVIVVIGGGTWGTFSLTFGDLLVILTTVAWTAYVIVSPRVHTPPVTTTTVQAGMAGVALIPLMVVDIALGNTGWLTIDPLTGLGILWIGLIPSAGAYFLWNVSSEKIGPTRTGAFLNLMPVFTALLVVALGGTISVMQILGGVIVLIGVTLSTSTSQSRPDALT